LRSLYKRDWKHYCYGVFENVPKESMKKSVLLVLVVPSLVASSGCFKHRETPHRPVVARSLSEAAAQKEAVERLNLTGLEIGDLSKDVAAMPKLKELWLRDAKNVGSLAALRSCKALRTLDLSSAHLSTVPEDVCAAVGLEQLYLVDNGISSLPPALGDLAALQYLNLDRNQLTALPAEMGKLGELRWLRLNENKLAELPADLAKLVKLQRIYLRQNNFELVPECLKGLPLMEDISLSGNRIKEIPAWMTEIPKLRRLDFDGCAITKLPQDLSGWQHLQVLSLVRCPLDEAEKVRIRSALPEVHVAF